ncbi:MAG TPA: endo-1,4-beta-xylanase [Firmicutes bacterium]|jgi:GH35 family endo-1,4-beta-xylanase|nr:endo-1,4-beta-xylanase [Bacillota bacterium]
MKTLCLQKHGLFQPLLIIVVLIFSSCVLTSQTNTAEVGDILYYEGFESTNSLQQNGTATIALSDVYAAAGDKSLSVEPVADNNWSGVALRNDSLATPMLPSGKYRLTAKILSPKNTTVGIRVETKDSFGMDTYGSVGSAKVNLVADQWVDVTMDFAVPADHQSVVAIVFHNDDQIPNLHFYLDEVKLLVTGLPLEPKPTPPQEIVFPQWDLSLPSLKDTYKDYFMIGNIISPYQMDLETTAMYKHHYNLVTAENDMKPQYFSPAKGIYLFENADWIIDWAEANDLKVHGHVLVWHSQSARWLNTGLDGKPLTRAEAKSNMEEYITNVAGHFRGKVISWDVVNEAFTDRAGIPTDWKEALRQDVPWYLAYENGADKSKGESGADYIYDAFVFARLTDPGATLFYNDYNETDSWKREAMAMMAEELNAKWKTDERNTEPDRLLIEALGMQAHYWTASLRVQDVEAAIKRFIEAGVKVGITELDIPYGSWTNQHSDPLTAEEERNQARLYAELFKIYKKYASHIDRVTFWGKADSQSWRAKGSPLLFNRAFGAKQSFYAVIDPEGFLSGN